MQPLSALEEEVKSLRYSLRSAKAARRHLLTADVDPEEVLPHEETPALGELFSGMPGKEHLAQNR